MSSYKISYGFLAFNRWDTLEQTLESALALKHSGEREWVIIDNSLPAFQTEMTDKITEWCNRRIPKSDNIIHVSNAENTGEGQGNNQIIEMANSEYILFLQDDWKLIADHDLPFVDMAVKALDSNPSLGLVQMVHRKWSDTNQNIKKGALLGVHGNMNLWAMKQNGFGNNTLQPRLMKKTIFNRLGMYTTAKTIDWNRWKGAREGSIVEFEFGLKLAMFGYCGAKINNGQFKHLIEENARSEYFIKG